MKKLAIILAIVASAPGCSMLPDVSLFSQNAPQGDRIVNVDNAAENVSKPNALVDEGTDNFGAIVRPKTHSTVNGAYKSRPLAKNIGDYVRNMAQDLVANMEYVTERTPVAVTHFSLIDSSLKETNLLGHQMAESFAHEFHKFRMPVVEFKSTQFIRVTEQGDFVLSRDFLDLTSSTPIQYVLTGTMTKHQGGFIVNARMLGMESSVIVASAQMFIPYYVVDALIPSESSRQSEVVDGVRLIRGE